MALTPEQTRIIAKFVREDVRQNAFGVARTLLSLEDAADRYSNDIQPIVQADTSDPDQIDEQRNDGVPPRTIAELKAVLVILNKVRNSLTEAERTALRAWLVSGRVGSF